MERGVPQRPAALVITLPDFAIYAERYVIQAELEGVRHEFAMHRRGGPQVAWWRIEEAPPRRRGRRPQATPADDPFWLHFWAARDAAAALLAAEWSFDVALPGWLPPAAFQVIALQAALAEVR